MVLIILKRNKMTFVFKMLQFDVLVLLLIIIYVDYAT